MKEQKGIVARVVSDLLKSSFSYNDLSMFSEVILMLYHQSDPDPEGQRKVTDYKSLRRVVVD